MSESNMQYKERHLSKFRLLHEELGFATSPAEKLPILRRMLMLLTYHIDKTMKFIHSLDRDSMTMERGDAYRSISGMERNIKVINDLITQYEEQLPSNDNNQIALHAQWRTNYDYGEGMYMNLDKYKSVTDFRKKRRKKRRKDIDNILNSRPDRYKA